MNSEDVAKYLGVNLKQVYKSNLSIRKKLCISRDDSGLPDYMFRLFASSGRQKQ